MVQIPGKPIKLFYMKTGQKKINNMFEQSEIQSVEGIYVPESLKDMFPEYSYEPMEFIEDDNRSAIYPEPFVTIGKTDFYLCVKGIGSTTDPYSMELLNRSNTLVISRSRSTSERLNKLNDTLGRFITGEVWLRGSPYGGQGEEHGIIALKTSNMAEPLSINGFMIAPVIRLMYLPEEMENEIRGLYWYRKFKGRFVQELRLVPSNVRIYFHSYNTLGSNISRIFDMFSIESNMQAIEFEINFIRSGLAALSIFARTMRIEEDGSFSGLDYFDVWIDKDAVVAPDGTLYFVDLEGVERNYILESRVGEKIDEQFYRSLYEFTFAMEQFEQERQRRFNDITERRVQFPMLVQEALKNEPILKANFSTERLQITIQNTLRLEKLYRTITLIDL